MPWFYVILPVVAAVVFESHVRFLSQHMSLVTDYLAVFVMLLAINSPMLLAHYAAYRLHTSKAVAVWLVGFTIYPLIRFAMFPLNYTAEGMPAITMQGWLFPAVASGLWFLFEYLKKRHKRAHVSLISKLFSLNSMLVVLIFTWAAFVSGIFTYTNDPMNNQPLAPVIDPVIIAENFLIFIEYFLQFVVVGSLVFSVFLINRYYLIQYVLAQYGIVSFLLSALVVILIATPILCGIALLLPLNVEDYSLLPSTDYNVFSPNNYRFTFVVLFVTTPVILAFERQQQSIALAQIAEQQTQTELKLLQQQINPHFLFNTLNNLYALALKKSDDCPNMVMQLSNLLRYSVYEGQNKRVTLAQEVTYLQDYLELQKIRWGNECELHASWPNDTHKWQISPMLLIMLVENAIKYGVEAATSEAKVTIDLIVKNNMLTLICINSISSKPSSESGVGLANLNKRLELLYPDKHSLDSEQHGDLWRAELNMELEQC